MEKSQSKIINIRINGQELDRCKEIASKKGLPYQTYIKSILKMAMDKDQEQLGLI